MSKKNILFINAIPDRLEIRLKKIDEEGKYILDYIGNMNIYSYYPTDKLDTTQLTLDAKRDQEIKMPRIDAIFNQVSDANSHKVALSKMENIYFFRTL